jgi:excinuclease UvrABC nuclease subunit
MIQDIDIDVNDWSMFSTIKLGEKIPKIPCVYFLFRDNELVYIGQTKDLFQRISHLEPMLNPNLYLGKKKISEDVFNKIFYRVEDDKEMRKRLEKKYYDTFQPKLNFSGLLSNAFLYGSKADYMKYRMNMGLEKRYNLEVR